MHRVSIVLALCAAPLVATALRAQDRWAQADSSTVRLPASAFPQLPPAVARALEQRHCRVPQAVGRPSPNNVIAGQFGDSAAPDWAMLCSVNDSSRILVFRAGDSTRPAVFPASADRDYLQRLADGIGFSRYIAVAGPKALRSHGPATGNPAPPRYSHDGIEDGFGGKGSVILYWQAGRWLTLGGAD